MSAHDAAMRQPIQATSAFFSNLPDSASLFPSTRSKTEFETIVLVSKTKPQVILIAYHFPPGPEMGALRPFRFYKYLKRLGFQCHVITASPPDQASPADVSFIPDELRAVWEGSTKQRLSLRAYQELLVRKLMFPGHIGIMWSIKAASLCHKIIADHPRDQFVLFSTYPPLGVLLTGLIVRQRDRIPWIADFRDPLGIGLGEAHVSRWMRFWNRRLESTVFRAAGAIIANVEGAAQLWRERYPRAQAKLHVICNGFDPEEAPRPRETPPRTQKLIVHAGGLYHGRSPEMVVQSLSRLRAKGESEALSAGILLVGDFDVKVGLTGTLYQQAQHDGWLELRHAVPRKESLRLLEEADGLLLIQPQSDVQVPGKIFEYICIGRPVLAIAPRASAVDWILQNAGPAHICLHPADDPDTADRKVLEFLRLPVSPVPYSMWFQNNFNAAVQASQLASIIENIQ